MNRPIKEGEQDAKYWQNKYYTLQSEYKKEVIAGAEREKRNKQTRFELLMEIKDIKKAYEVMEDNFHSLLKLRQPVDKSRSTT